MRPSHVRPWEVVFVRWQARPGRASKIHVADGLVIGGAFDEIYRPLKCGLRVTERQLIEAPTGVRLLKPAAGPQDLPGVPRADFCSACLHEITIGPMRRAAEMVRRAGVAVRRAV